MASSPDSISMALFCDFENVALGVRDANYEKFDIKRVLERLLLKGSIVANTWVPPCQSSAPDVAKTRRCCNSSKPLSRAISRKRRA